jgi:hypothetical protein
MGPKALTFIHSLARKSLTKGQGSGITKIPSAMQAEAKASEIFTNLVEAGLKPEMMDDFIKSEADVAKYLNILDAYKANQLKILELLQQTLQKVKKSLKLCLVREVKS